MLYNTENSIFTDKDAEKLVESYLLKHSFDPVPINTKKLEIGVKSPDFQVYFENKLLFYTEIKNPLLLASNTTNMFHWTTTISKIRRFIRRAVNQFRDIDSNHNFPWLIAFTSSHAQLNWLNFSDAYLGYISRNGQMISDLRQEKYVTNYNIDVNTVDAYLWFQVNEKDKKIYQFVPIVNSNSILKRKLEVIIDKLLPLESEDILDLNTRKYK